jgi:hypothetical protein
VLSAAWQCHVHDRHLALKKARYLSLKVTYVYVEIGGSTLLKAGFRVKLPYAYPPYQKRGVVIPSAVAAARMSSAHALR